MEGGVWGLVEIPYSKRDKPDKLFFRRTFAPERT